jgi:hypothetical protein
MNYGTLIDNTLHPAPRAVRIGGAVVCNPTDAQYEAAGYKRVVDNPPQTDAAHYAVPIGWSEQGGEIVRQYEVRAYPPPPPRRWSRLAIKTALAQAGMLSQALAYLAQVEIATGYSAAEALQDCDYVEEGYPNAARWSALLDGAANALGKTRAEIDAFLAHIPQEA